MRSGGLSAVRAVGRCCGLTVVRLFRQAFLRCDGRVGRQAFGRRYGGLCCRPCGRTAVLGRFLGAHQRRSTDLSVLSVPLFMWWWPGDTLIAPSIVWMRVS